MASPASHATPAPGRPLLIAVAGLGPRTGVTTTTVALAHGWPGPQPAVVVEADPAGGQLADLAGADAYRGLASMAQAVRSGAQRVRIAEHLQTMAGGVGFLAAPPGADGTRAQWVTTLLTGPGHDRQLEDLSAWRTLGATVFADCGAPGPGSAIEPILTAADACLLLVRTDLTDPVRAGHQIRTLTDRCRRRAVLLLGPGSDYAHALALPVLGHLRLHRHSATTLIHRHRPPHRHNQLLPPIREIATTLNEHLHPPAPASTADAAQNAHPTVRPRLRIPGRREPTRPTVYRIELPTSSPAPQRARTDPNPAGPDTGTIAVVPRPGPPPRTAPPATRETPSRPPQRPALPPRPAPSEPAAGPGLAIRIFGPTRVLWRATDPPHAGTAGIEITRGLQPRSRELLTVLALHPEGVSRGDLIEALWGRHPPDRPGIALTNALGRLRAAVSTATNRKAVLLIEDRPRYRLDPAAVIVDYWEFTAAVTMRRSTSDEAAYIAASKRILDIATATATLAADLSDPWVEPLREAARRNTLNALGWLAAHTVSEDPRITLGMLETAVETDPYNEPLWQDILRLHAKLGEHDALTRTYSLLTKKLTEIDATPSPETRQLLEHLRHTTR
ncbi:BTAD domain-containing putative transcriptional regulator [Nocardia nova]|uniref:BTAD domain-containing putative transcriptional regulator n=1 Tax=Nocardia nova TaxID=37330 RepID=UPI00379A4248